MNDNSLLLNFEIDTELLIVPSNMSGGKKRILEAVCTTVKSCHTIYPCCSSLLNFCNQID